MERIISKIPNNNDSPIHIDSEYFENIIHDIKTPLSIILDCIFNLEATTQLPDASIGLIKNMKNQLYRIMKLIRDISDYERVNSGGLLPKLRNYDIIALIRNITDSTKTLADRKKITIKFCSDLKSLTMSVDKTMIERIMLNLLSNAIKFTDVSGLIQVVLELENNIFSIRVIDDGIGMNATEINNIFNRYYQAGSHNKAGTGIGLSIVKQFAYLLNGNVHTESDDKGTEVRVDLPYAVLQNSPAEIKYYDDFYSDNIIQIELSDEYL